MKSSRLLIWFDLTSIWGSKDCDADLKTWIEEIEDYIFFLKPHTSILLKSGQQQDFKSTLVTFVYLRFEFESKEVIKKDYYVIKPIKPKLVINSPLYLVSATSKPVQC